MAHIHVNWLAPVKIRRTLISGSRKMIVYDDLEPSEKVKIYDKGIELTDSKESIYKMLIGYRTGDLWVPQLDLTEALKTEACHFVECIEQVQTPISNGESGLRVVRILEAATQSMVEKGRPIEL
jgi:predicted dehydrogenase